MSVQTRDRTIPSPPPAATRRINWVTPLVSTAALAVISLVLLLVWFLYKWDLAIRTSPLPVGDPNTWEPSYLSTVLGITGQIIGFIITVLVTGLFVVSQYFADRLPATLVRRHLWQTTAGIPLLILFLGLVYDLVLFYFTRKGFTPILEAGFVVFITLVTIPFCLIHLTNTVKSLNMPGLVETIKSNGLKALEVKNVNGLTLALNSLSGLLQHSLDQGYENLANSAFDALTSVSLKWTPEIDATFKTLSGSKHKELYNSCHKTIHSGLNRALALSAAGNRISSFQHFVIRGIRVLRELPSPVRHDYEEALTGSTGATLGPEYLSKVPFGLMFLAADGTKHDDETLLAFGNEFAHKLWTRTHDLDIKAAVVRSYGVALSWIHEKQKTSSTLRTSRDSWVDRLLEFGRDIVQNEYEPLYVPWLMQFEAILALVSADEDSQAVSRLVKKARQVYNVALERRCDTILMSLPKAIVRGLSAGPSRFCVDATVQEAVLLFDPPAQPGAELLPLIPLFTWLFHKGIQSNKLDIAKTAIAALCRFPLLPSVVNNYFHYFLGKAISDIERMKHRDLANALFNHLVALLESNRTLDFNHLVFVTERVRQLLESNLLTIQSSLLFVGACKQPFSDELVTHTLFSQLNSFTSKSRNLEVLQAAHDVYRNNGLNAAEGCDLDGLKTASNYMGWLGYHVINADMDIGKKAHVLRNIAGTAQLFYRFAQRLGLPRHVLVHLASLYVVLGARCEVLAPSSGRAELVELIMGSTVGIVNSSEDVGIVEDALFLKINNGVGISEITSSKPYVTFWTAVKARAGVP